MWLKWGNQLLVGPTRARRNRCADDRRRCRPRWRLSSWFNEVARLNFLLAETRDEVAVSVKVNQIFPLGQAYQCSSKICAHLRTNPTLNFFEGCSFAIGVLAKHIVLSIQRSVAVRNHFNVSSEDDIITLDEVVYRYVQSVINVLGGNASEAAKRLGAHRQTIKKILENGSLKDSEQESEN